MSKFIKAIFFQKFDVPTTNPVVGPEISFIVPEIVGHGPVPFRVNEHIITVLMTQPCNTALHSQISFLQVHFQDL